MPEGAGNGRGGTDDIFDTMGERFDMDVASPADREFCSVPAESFITEDSLGSEWRGFVWMNPPFGDAANKMNWIEKFIWHGNGVALTPDRTCTAWWHLLARNTDAVLFCSKRVAFIRPDGSSPGSGGANTCLWAIGDRARLALLRAQSNDLGMVFGRIG